MTVINVCSWCRHELLKSGEPGKKYEPGCTSAMASYGGCCNQCRRGIEAKIKACRTSRRLDRAVKVHLILAGAGLEG